MSRRNQASRRKVTPDPIFESEIITKVINNIMHDGKKSQAQKILYTAFDLIKEKTQQDPMETFQTAVKNITPVLEIKTRRIGGANYQVPIEVSEVRKRALALRWLINYARLRTEYTMQERIANEIIDASKGLGAAVKKKTDTHKMAEANKAFAHYRW